MLLQVRDEGLYGRRRFGSTHYFACYLMLRNGQTVGGDGMDRHNLIVLGGGAAGITAAKTALALGASVALIDRGPLGGACINRG
jgi:NADPH-dependent 2,4-dienoyl-CoA reductase/sulfur reductase-like enzyme